MADNVRSISLTIAMLSLALALALALALPTAGSGPAYAQGAMPNFSGAWARRGDEVDVKTAPPLTPAGQKQFEINKAGIEASDPNVDVILACLPAGFPRLIIGGQPFYITQGPAALSWVGGGGGRPQMIYFRDKHRDLWPLWMGDSIGRWEGDTLVVDVNQVIAKTFMHDAGLPHSEQFHVVERLRLIEGGKALENRIRMEDPKVLTGPWEFTLVYERTDDLPVEYVCENTRLR